MQDCWQNRKQAGLKSGKSGIQQQLDAVKAKIEREQNDLKAKRGKINYRSTDEIDREMKYFPPSLPTHFPLFSSSFPFLMFEHTPNIIADANSVE